MTPVLSNSSQPRHELQSGSISLRRPRGQAGRGKQGRPRAMPKSMVDTRRWPRRSRESWSWIPRTRHKGPVGLERRQGKDALGVLFVLVRFGPVVLALVHPGLVDPGESIAQQEAG